VFIPRRGVFHPGLLHTLGAGISYLNVIVKPVGYQLQEIMCENIFQKYQKKVIAQKCPSFTGVPEQANNAYIVPRSV
jgi:hypothetical protein